MATATATVRAGSSRGRAFLRALFGTHTAPLAADILLVIVRTVLAWVFIYHGARRLFGWFDGPGLDASARYFANTAGLSPGKLFALLGGLIEFGGGIAIAFGFLSRLAGAGTIIALSGDGPKRTATVRFFQDDAERKFRLIFSDLAPAAE